MRLRELYESINLFENYNGKVNKLKKEFPEDAAAIDKHVAWAVTYLKKNQAILWLLTIMEAGLNRNQEALANLLPPAWLNDPTIFDSLESLKYSLSHWLSTELAENKRITDAVNAIRPGASIPAVIAALGTAEELINQDNQLARENQKSIEILQGDHPILQVPGTGRSWWHLPYNRHAPESTFMDHCGTCQFPGNNLLSLRNAIPRPELTFEWNPETNELYQTKGPKNSKPNKQYYPDILALLLSPAVNGIASESWFPGTDFSLFDLPEKMLNEIVAAKPKLIYDQIEKYPIDFLRAPKSVLANENFRSVAFDVSPGLESLVTDTGELNNSDDAWEQAIQSNQNLIIYAPETIQNYKQRVGVRVGKEPNLLNYANAKVRNDVEILKYGIKNNTGDYTIFEYISDYHKHYKELVNYAFETRDDWDMFDFDRKYIDLHICTLAVANSNYPADLLSTIEYENYLDRNDLNKLVDQAVELNPHIVSRIPEHFLTFDRLKSAASIQGDAIDPSEMDSSLDEIVDQQQLYELAVIAVRTSPFLIHEFVNRYSFSDEEVLNMCISAVSTRSLTSTTMQDLIENGFFRSGIPTYKVASTAIKNGASIAYITPIADDEDMPVEAGYVTAEQYQKLAELAIKIDGYNLKSVNDEFKTFELSKAAISNNPTAVNFINRELLTTKELDELWTLAHGAR